jgi:hypothetical protein
LNYERNGTGFYCLDHDEVYEIYLQSKEAWTCLSTVREAQKPKAPEMIARLGFRPNPAVFFAICEGWFHDQARQGLGVE